jgi:phosphoribosylglycinamide formyltransferase-1
MAVRVAVLVSGQGSNLQALLDAEAAGLLAPAEVALVLSSRAAAPALDRARAAGKPALALEPAAHGGREGHEAAMLAVLAERGIEAVVLAGFMRVLSAGFLSAFPDRVVNTHPALLPAFPGLDAVGQALAHGVRVSGCTVHLVDAGVDSGPIIAQRAVPVLPGDDAAALQRRIQVEEHRLLPAVVRLLAAGRLAIDGRRVSLRGPAQPGDELITGVSSGAPDRGGG